jgi:hypothetical protein
MFLACTCSTEVIDMDEEDQSPPRPRLSRREPSTRELLTSEGASPDEGTGGCIYHNPGVIQPLIGGRDRDLNRNREGSCTRD